jgi:hypothetical protein
MASLKLHNLLNSHEHASHHAAERGGGGGVGGGGGGGGSDFMRFMDADKMQLFLDALGLGIAMFCEFSVFLVAGNLNCN